MKLPKVSARLILRSATAAIVIFMVLVGLWLAFEGRLVEGRLVVPYLPILTFGGLLFFVTYICIHGVTKKHPRATIAARVLGAFGASRTFSLFLRFHYFPYPHFPFTPIPMALFMSLMLCMSLMAIIGVKLALARPKTAGVLMLLAGMMPWIVLFLLMFFPLFLLFLFDVFAQQWDPAWGMFLGLSIILPLPVSLLLIPGGVLTLLSARRKQPGNRVIAAFIVVPVIAFTVVIIILFSRYVLLHYLLF